MFIYDVFHLKKIIYLKILDQPSRFSTKLFLNFIRIIVVLDFFFQYLFITRKIR
jgi:hypothetical protein